MTHPHSWRGTRLSNVVSFRGWSWLSAMTIVAILAVLLVWMLNL